MITMSYEITKLIFLPTSFAYMNKNQNSGLVILSFSRLLQSKSYNAQPTPFPRYRFFFFAIAFQDQNVNNDLIMFYQNPEPQKLRISTPKGVAA